MKYNIHYDIAAALIGLVIFFFSSVQYSSIRISNKMYKLMCLTLVLGAVLDAFTGVTSSNPDMVPMWVNMTANTVFFIMSLSIGFTYELYVSTFIHNRYRNDLNNRINIIIAVLYCILMICNIWTGWIFTLENNVYEFGPLHIITYFLPSYFVLDALAVAIMNRKAFTKKQFIAVVFYTPISAVGMLFQMLFIPDILVSYISSTLGCLVLLFTLETPDYKKLMQTMKELDEARREAQAATKAKSDFLARMSHEIRTPINAVIGMDEMILRENENDDINMYANNIQTAGYTLLSVINDILDFSKIESGKYEIVDVDYKLSTLILDCRNLILNRAEEKGLRVEVEIDETAPEMIVGDTVRVRQIVTNLLTNAVKYTKEGYVKLSVGWEKKNDNEVLLKFAVSDSGIGIAPENLDKVFTSFERADEVQNHAIEGTGLGLSITKQLAELMGGSVSVESTLNKGSTFTAVLTQKVDKYVPIGHPDLLAGQEKVMEKKVYKPKFVNPNACIMVVDDNKMNLMVIKSLLKKSGATVELCESGEQCLEKVTKKKYDIIFMDHMMPHMDGIETLKRLKALEGCINGSTPVIALTANAMSGADRIYSAAGFDGYLSKPVSYVELENLICNYVETLDKGDK